MLFCDSAILQHSTRPLVCETLVIALLDCLGSENTCWGRRNKDKFGPSKTRYTLIKTAHTSECGFIYLRVQIDMVCGMWYMYWWCSHVYVYVQESTKEMRMARRHFRLWRPPPALPPMQSWGRKCSLWRTWCKVK